MARPSPEQLVEFWDLRTMPTENVRFWQSYVDDKIGPDGKPLCSAIVALLVDDPSVFSDMHRLPTDEIWHFYLGDPIELLLLHPDGSDELVILGQDVLAGQRVQTVVPAGVYIGGAVTAWWRVRRLRQHDGAGVRSHRLRGRDRGGADYGLAATGRSDSRIDAR